MGFGVGGGNSNFDGWFMNPRLQKRGGRLRNDGGGVVGQMWSRCPL